MTNLSARVFGLYAGAFEWSYGFHFTSTTDVSSAATTLHDATNAFWTVATNGYQHYCFTDVAVTSVQTKVYNASWQMTGKKSLALAITGDGATASLAFTTCVNHRLLATSGMKGQDGHIKLPTPRIGAISAHLLSAALLASQQIIWLQFWTDMSALTGFQLVTFNRHTNKFGDPPFTNHLIGSTETSDKPGTARMRTRKVVPTFGTPIPVP